MKAPVISSWSFWLNGNFSFVINYDEPFWEAALFSPTSDISISTRGWGVQRTAVLVDLFGKCQQFKQQVEQIMLSMRFTLIAFLSLRLKYRFSAVHSRTIVEAAFWHPATISFCRIRLTERVQKLFRRPMPRWHKLSFLQLLHSISNTYGWWAVRLFTQMKSSSNQTIQCRLQVKPVKIIFRFLYLMMTLCMYVCQSKAKQWTIWSIHLRRQ